MSCFFPQSRVVSARIAGATRSGADFLCNIPGHPSLVILRAFIARKKQPFIGGAGTYEGRNMRDKPSMCLIIVISFD
jgi:hypothetical protein